MKYRLNKTDLLEYLANWNSFLKRKVNLIACGGTALTLYNVKDSTKDVDFIIPKKEEFTYLISILKTLGYSPVSGVGWSRGDNYIFDLFPGDKVHTTNLLESPLKEGNNILVKEFSHIYLGILNHYDLIISKLFRGTGVDFKDCLLLIKAKKAEIKLNLLKKRFLETSSFDISEKKVNKNLQVFLERIKKEGIYEKR